MEQDKVNKVSDTGKNVWDEDSDRRNTMDQKKKKVSFREWWEETRPTKTIVFWTWIASIVLTMIIGFAWGGWVTGGTAQKMAEVMAANAVTQRLVPICVDQFILNKGISLTFFRCQNLPTMRFYDKLDGS